MPEVKITFAFTSVDEAASYLNRLSGVPLQVLGLQGASANQAPAPGPTQTSGASSEPAAQVKAQEPEQEVTLEIAQDAMRRYIQKPGKSAKDVKALLVEQGLDRLASANPAQLKALHEIFVAA